MQRRDLALLTITGILACVADAQIVLPGTQPGEIVNWPLLRPDQSSPTPADLSCKDCHGGYVAGLEYEPFDSWAGSMMANSARDPLFWAALDIANQDVPGVGEFCLRCHTPAAWLAGRSSTPDGSALLGFPDQPDNDFEGIDCHFCHRMYEGPGGTPYTENGQYFVDDGTPSQEPPRRGPFQQAFAPHEWAYSSYHESGDFCGACHDLRNPLVELLDENGVSMGVQFPEQLTYSEWAQSDFASEGTSCQDCHMKAPTVAPVFACDSLNPVRPDPLTDNTPLARHDLAGANVFVLQLLKGEYGGSLGRNDSFDHTIAQALDMLQNQSATLEVTVPPQAVEQADVDVQVRVTNLSGHKLPTGYPEGRRMWLHVVATDVFGTPFWQSGNYDDPTATLITDPQLVVYETRHGVHGEGAGFHLVRNDRIFFDNRIPPRGFVPTPDSAPVGRVYPDQGGGVLAHWADENYSIPVPAGVTGPIQVTATLRYQTASREYIEFLRDENVSGPDPKDPNYPSAPSRGQKMYDFWSAYGKSAPIDMVFDGGSIPVVQAPAAISALSALSQHNHVQLSWSNPAGVSGVKIFRQAWFDYPEFGSSGSALPAPGYPSDIADAQALGWTEIYDGLAESLDDTAFDDASRTIAFYAAFAYDAQGISSLADPGAQARSTSYRLGDFGEVGNPGAYDGLIDGALDLPVFSLSYGASEGGPGWNPECDVAPTHDGSSSGIPLPDDSVGFDDLLIFALQFGSSSNAKPSLPLASKTPPLQSELSLGPLVRGEDGLLRAQLRARAYAYVLRGVSLELAGSAHAELLRVEPGPALTRSGAQFVGLAERDGRHFVDLALLGAEARLLEDGVLAVLVFDAGLATDPGALALGASVADILGRQEAVALNQLPDRPPTGAPGIALSPAAPNPFNPRTSFTLSVAGPKRVRAVIYDVAGRFVQLLADREFAAGSHELVWDGRDQHGRAVASGVYSCRVEADGEFAQRRMVLLK